MLKENVDVNCWDDKGWTLLALCLLNINKQSEEFVKFLLEEKKADPNIADIDDVSPLILLASAPLNISNTYGKIDSPAIR